MHIEHAGVKSSLQRLTLLQPLNMTNLPTVDLTFAGVDWRILHNTAPNALVIGPPMAVDAAIARLLPLLQDPISTWEPDVRREPSLPGTGTLIVRDADALDAGQQRQLLDYLSSPTRRVRVISLASSPVYPLVQRGAFLEALYYRLNILCFHVPH
jgi:Sigma-54 interaction domain